MVDDRSAVHLAGLAYELGEDAHDLADLELVLPGVRQSLREAGLSQYRTSSRSPAELAKVSLGQTIEQVDPSAIEAVRHVIYATNSMWETSFTDPATLGSLLCDLGLPGAYPYGIFLSYCANLQCALELGSSLIRAETAEHVLVVCTDKADPKSDRLVEPRISVHSDAAASFLLTSTPRRGAYLLRDTVLHIDPAMGAIDADRQFVEYFQAVTEGVAGVVERTMQRNGLTPSGLSRVFTNNYNETVSTIVAKLVGFGLDQLFLDNIGRFAHALAADALINMTDAAASSPWAGGEQLLVLGTGPIQWGCSLLEVVA